MSNTRDLTNERFGRLIVLNIVDQKIGWHSKWLCKCDCGGEICVRYSNLVYHKSKSCGCLQKERAGEESRKNLLHKRFGRLFVIKEMGRKRNGKRDVSVLWECVCDCGNKTLLTTKDLNHGHVKSCGCLQIETVTKRSTTHGLSHTNKYKRFYQRIRKERTRTLDTIWTIDMENFLDSTFDRCVVCGEINNLETDHALPLAMGFGLVPGNAVKLCKKCNTYKRDKMPYNLPASFWEKINIAAGQFKTLWDERQSALLGEP